MENSSDVMMTSTASPPPANETGFSLEMLNKVHVVAMVNLSTSIIVSITIVLYEL